MQRSEQLFQQAQQLFPGGVNSPVRAFGRVGGTPPYFKRGSGPYLFDEDDKQYIDYIGSWGPMVLGHAHPGVIEAVQKAASDSLSFGAPTAVETELALKIQQHLPSMEMMRMVSSGTEATMSAIRLARGFTGRDKILKFEGCYHGHSDSLLVKAGSGALTIGEPDSAGVPIDLARLTLTLPYNNLEAVEQLFAVDGSNIAAIIVEPIQGEGGYVVPEDDFLPRLREICDQHGILLVFDEVICGFGRTGRMFATEHFDVQPDIMTMAKGLTSGYVPLGAVGCSDQVLEPIEVLNHLHTYGNHPVACAVGLKNLEILETEKLIENSEKMGRYFLDGLKTLEHHPSVGEVRGTGLWLAIDFTINKKSRASFPLENLMSIIRRAKQKGILVKTMGMALEFAPPLIIKKEEIDAAILVLDACITEEEKAMGLSK